MSTSPALSMRYADVAAGPAPHRYAPSPGHVSDRRPQSESVADNLPPPNDEIKLMNYNVTLGCPQGFPLIPLLWNVLIYGLLWLNFPGGVSVQVHENIVILLVSGKL